MENTLNLHPLKLTKSILDPIHGLVRFTTQEIHVINHRIYQRLRKIKQNGLLHFIFPSATHTRFEHSLGVLFVADSMLRSLIFNSISATSKQKTVADVGQAKDGQAVDLTSVPADVLGEVFRITRLAALVHDLGHGPLSHTFDNFAPGFEAVVSMLGDARLNALRGFEAVFQAYAKKHDEGAQTKGRVPHEVMSCVFFALIWAEVEPNDHKTPRAVAAAILGKQAFPLVEKEILPWVALIHDIVASAPADADRMDYLERDSRSCGVSYGLFDRNRLLKTMLCYQSNENGQLHYRLGLKFSGFRAVENFVQARFELFVQVYYHKTNRAIESMLGSISNLASLSQDKVVAETSINELIEDYVNLGDDHFLDILRGSDGKRSVSNKEINELASKIHDRQLWRRVLDFQEVGKLDPKKEVAIVKQDAIFQQLSGESSKHKLHSDQVPPKATKDLNEGAVILQQGTDGIYSARLGTTWESISPIINTLGEEEKLIRRIYVQSDDADVVKDLRAKARKILSTY